MADKHGVTGDDEMFLGHILELQRLVSDWRRVRDFIALSEHERGEVKWGEVKDILAQIVMYPLSVLSDEIAEYLWFVRHHLGAENLEWPTRIRRSL